MERRNFVLGLTAALAAGSVPKLVSADYYPTYNEPGPWLIKKASYYDEKGCLGCRGDLKMANGKKFDEKARTLAFMRTDLDVEVWVFNLITRMGVLAKVTDRGAFERYGRGADLSLGTASAVGLRTDETPLWILRALPQEVEFAGEYGIYVPTESVMHRMHRVWNGLE